jgi:tripartite-type tricarboxylate transporter receptor subunit TctC
MPGDVVKKLHAELIKTLKLADVQERLKSVGVGDIIGSTPGEAAQFVRAESVRWAEVIRASGAKAD